MPPKILPRNFYDHVAEYKINLKKSVALIYTEHKWADKEIRETSPLATATNSIKYLRVTLTKEVEDLYEL